MMKTNDPFKISGIAHINTRYSILLFLPQNNDFEIVKDWFKSLEMTRK